MADMETVKLGQNGGELVLHDEERHNHVNTKHIWCTAEPIKVQQTAEPIAAI